MNIHKLVKKRQRMLWMSMAASVLALLGCQERVIPGGESVSEGGGSMDETSTLAFHRRDGKPAVGARVQLYGSADTGVQPRVQVIADEKGGVEVPVPEKGYYNLVVRGRDGDALFQDSLYSNGTVFSIASDTLMRTGVLTGRIRVQPQHSPRIAWIHVLGAGIWSNVDDSGRFKLEGVPAGKYTVAAYTLVEGYTPTFAKVQTISDRTVDAGDISMVFTGLPVVHNLEARFDTLAGLVYLRWDSIPLRETWRYNVYRNDTLLGASTGARWEDDVSKQYPANLPAQGRHTYRVALANADEIGPKWESITMQIISPFLYQELKIDWEKRAELPWPSGIFRIDTVGQELVVWRSAEFGTTKKYGEFPVRNLHVGWVEMWISSDSGYSWERRVDSLSLGALPVRFGGKWWSVKRGQNRYLNMDSIEILSTYNTAAVYASAEVMASDDGVQWNSINRVDFNTLYTAIRLEQADSGLRMIAGCANSKCPDNQKYYPMNYVYDMDQWSLMNGVWQSEAWSSFGTNQAYGIWLNKKIWSGQWWEIKAHGGVLNGMNIPTEINSSYSEIEQPLNNIFFPISWGDKIVFFRMSDAISFDTAGLLFHSLVWPGKGKHFEIRYGEGILSISDAGIYHGRITNQPLGDPRGTWVKKTEIPSLFEESWNGSLSKESSR